MPDNSIPRVFIGYDGVESVAFYTLIHSINKHASGPVMIIPVNLRQLAVYTRKRDPKQSNEFSFTRFLTPWMCGFEGWAIFMDCDMMLRGDIYELWNQRHSANTVQVVQHDYIPNDEYKYLGAKQYIYPKKNWSSVMLFNCDECKVLTPEYINFALPMSLHQFAWAKKVGNLPTRFNHLVGEYEHNPEALIVHFTVGGPYFHEYNNCDYAQEWFDLHAEMNFCAQMQVPKTKVSER